MGGATAAHQSESAWNVEGKSESDRIHLSRNHGKIKGIKT